jgi:hypothetical protein
MTETHCQPEAAKKGRFFVPAWLKLSRCSRHFPSPGFGIGAQRRLKGHQRS